MRNGISRWWCRAAQQALLLGVGGLTIAPPAHGAVTGGVLGIRATDRALQVRVTAAGARRLRLVALRPFEIYAPDARQPIAWEGRARSGIVTIGRFDGTRDRLY